MEKSYGRIYQNKNNVSITPLDIYNVYPVGSIYISVVNTNPSTYFGGTWERLQNGFLYATSATSGTAGNSGNGTGTSTSGASGNTGSTVLTINQIPSHSHIQTGELRYSSSSSWWIGGSGGTTVEVGDYATANTGGGQGHTHTLNNHTHKIPYITVYMWRRIS